MARRAMLYGLGLLLGMVCASGWMTGCAHAGQIHTLSGTAATQDVDSTNCASPLLTPAGTQSIMRWLYRQSGVLVQYDSLGIVAPGARWTMPALWLPAGRYYEQIANRDSGGVTPCPIVRWFTVRGMPLPPTPDPIPANER